MIQKYDINGNQIWSEVFESKESLPLYGAVGEQTVDGGFIILSSQGRSFSEESGLLLIKTDETGNTLWTKYFSCDKCEGYDAKQTLDGGYILLAERNNDKREILLIKTDSDGNVVSSSSERKSTPNINVYPSPFKDLLNVETNTLGYYIIEFTSLNGKLVLNTMIEGSTKQLDLSSFPKGVYFITIRSRDQVWTEKIIKL
jgi:predicted enzyme related to lactoylglutathione lyase